jgi:gluconolactonase
MPRHPGQRHELDQRTYLAILIGLRRRHWLGKSPAHFGNFGRRTLYRLDPADGALTVVADDFVGLNGLCFSPHEDLFYVAEHGRQFATDPVQHIRVFDVLGERLGKGRVFHTVSPGFADGFRCDEEGRIWTSVADGVHCVDPSGALIGKIRAPSTVSNLTFSGRYRSQLFLCASHTLYAIYTDTRGAARP